MSLKQLGLLFLPLIFLQSHAYISNQPLNMNTQTFEQLIREKNITSIEELVVQLPTELKLNFILKHGIRRIGERGHLVENKISQSADPELPRAILWTENNGFSISYNGSGSHQLAPNRLDILSFDIQKKTFQLSAINFPLTEEQIRNQNAPLVRKDSSCKECHGPSMRPIFSMYPDWPAFYGSDNDELSNSMSLVQAKEKSDYDHFKQKTVPNSQRFQPLYDEN